MIVVGVVSTIALVLLHEYLASRREPGRARAAVIRRLVLLLLLGSTAVTASRLPRLISALETRTANPEQTEDAGDPLLTEALAGQRPERPFPDASAADEVRAWQADVRRELATRAEIDHEPPPDAPVEIVRTDQIGTIRRTLLRLTSWDGTRIPAYVHQPEAGALLPGVLVVPGHGAGIRATAGIEPRDYQHGAALELARNGYITLTPELRGFGLLTREGLPSHRAVAYAALEAGTFYKAIVVRDLRVALTALAGWHGVDESRLAIAGTSLGAELGVMLAALDPRARVVVSQGYGGATGPTGVAGGADDGEDQTPHGCHTFPGINRVIWQEDWFRVLAPRPVLVVRGTGNVPRAAREFDAAVALAFTALGAAERYEFATVPGGHEFFLDPAIRFLQKWL